MRRPFQAVLIFLLALLLCAALFSCKKDPESPSKGDTPKEDQNTEQPDTPSGEEELNPKKDGDTYRY